MMLFNEDRLSPETLSFLERLRETARTTYPGASDEQVEATVWWTTQVASGLVDPDTGFAAVRMIHGRGWAQLPADVRRAIEDRLVTNEMEAMLKEDE